MRWAIKRRWLSNRASIGELYLPETVMLCNSLEDRYRGDHLFGGTKVDGATAIPCGIYETVIDKSDRFQRDMPHLLDVPFFTGIRVHWGNDDVDTEGCPLTGDWDGKNPDWISASKDHFNVFFDLLKSYLAKERVWVHVFVDTSGGGYDLRT